jgi:hypothetical protein
LIKIKKWATLDDEDAPSIVKKLTLSNNSKADMTFNLAAEGPFEIVKTKSNTGAKHPLSNQGASKILNKKVETMFSLQPLKIVELGVKFLAPKPSERDNWPMIMEDTREGQLQVAFSNGDQQNFILKGLLMRPRLVLLTEKVSKNDKA